MKPKNSPERNKAFLRFVIFYGVTTVLIITAIFFGLQVPFKQNKQLQSQLDQIYKERDFDREFFNVMRETKKLLDTIDRAGTGTDLVEGRITQNIQKMDAMLSQDSISKKRIYGLMVQTFTDATNDKKTIRAASNKDAAVAAWNKKYNDLLQNRDDWMKEHERLKTQIMQMQTRQ